MLITTEFVFSLLQLVSIEFPIVIVKNLYHILIIQSMLYLISHSISPSLVITILSTVSTATSGIPSMSSKFEFILISIVMIKLLRRAAQFSTKGTQRL